MRTGVVTYGSPAVNVAIECNDCNEVLLDFDKDGDDGLAEKKLTEAWAQAEELEQSLGMIEHDDLYLFLKARVDAIIALLHDFVREDMSEYQALDPVTKDGVTKIWLEEVGLDE